MIFVRELVLVCLRQNIVFKAKHIRPVSFAGPTFQEASTSLHESYANSNTATSSPCKLAPIVRELLPASLQPSSFPTYQRAWKLYKKKFKEVFIIDQPFRCQFSQRLWLCLLPIYLRRTMLLTLLILT